MDILKICLLLFYFLIFLILVTSFIIILIFMFSNNSNIWNICRSNSTVWCFCWSSHMTPYFILCFVISELGSEFWKLYLWGFFEACVLGEFIQRVFSSAGYQEVLPALDSLNSWIEKISDYLHSENLGCKCT